MRQEAEDAAGLDGTHSRLRAHVEAELARLWSLPEAETVCYTRRCDYFRHVHYDYKRSQCNQINLWQCCASAYPKLFNATKNVVKRSINWLIRSKTQAGTLFLYNFIK